LLYIYVGIVASYVQSGWEADMNLAKSIGIDAFALDIGKPRGIAQASTKLNHLPYSGKDSYNDQQLGFAYAAAANLDFKVTVFRPPLHRGLVQVPTQTSTDRSV
jgi:glucan endo-1,3-alpha-glucosidase